MCFTVIVNVKYLITKKISQVIKICKTMSIQSLSRQSLKWLLLLPPSAFYLQQQGSSSQQNLNRSNSNWSVCNSSRCFWPMVLQIYFHSINTEIKCQPSNLLMKAHCIMMELFLLLAIHVHRYIDKSVTSVYQDLEAPETDSEAQTVTHTLPNLDD